MEGTIGISTCFVILIFLVNLVIIISCLLSVALFGMHILEHTNLKAFLRKAFFLKKIYCLTRNQTFHRHTSH